MVKRPARSTGTRSANMSVEQMKRGVERLQRRISDLESFNPRDVSDRWAPEIGALETAIKDTLDKVFGHDTVERERFEISALDSGPLMMAMHGRPAPDFHPYLIEGKARVLAELKSAVKSLEEELDEQASFSAPQVETVKVSFEAAPTRKVFIVHGRSEGPREAVARFLAKIGFEPIILHEQANQGRTVIEKLEATGDVGFAVILLTADDEGAFKGEPLQPRARQNVILELGYFIGRLGRERVCTIVDGNIEIPSDWMGIIYQSYATAWQQNLAGELQAAGYPIDWNSVMRP